MLANCHEMLVFGTKMVHLTSCGQSTSLLDVSQKWTGACDRRSARLVSYIITQLTIDNIVVWVTRVSIANWIYSKTQTLLAPFRTQNPPRWSEGSYVSSEVEHSLPSAGCALSKRQYPAVLHFRKSCRWMLDREWMNHLLLIYGM